MSRLRVAIIGQGRSGRDIHGAHLIRDIDRFEIAAVVDPVLERRQRAGNEYGCDVYADYAPLKLRSDIDLVVICAPSRWHVPISLDLLQSGFNVLCEKPLASAVADVDLLIAAAATSGKLLAVFQQSRYAPYFQKVQEIIDSGDIGKVIQINIAFSGFSRRYDWQTLGAELGGNLLNTGPHPLDQALCLMGDGCSPEVFCIRRNAISYGDADDHTVLMLTAEGAPTVHIEISSCRRFTNSTYEVYGTRGGLKGTMQRIEWQRYRVETAPELHLITTPLSKPDGTPSYCTDDLEWESFEWSMPPGPGLFEQMTASYYSMLHRSLTTGVELEVTLAQVRRQISVIEQALQTKVMPL